MSNYISELNEQQIGPVLDTEGAVLVLAGAGSGKTRVLTSRIAHLIKDKHVSPYSILAITFTNKAAKEMRGRIEKITECDYMWVSTIHSMCTRILRSDIDRLGYTSNFTIFADEEKKRTVKKIIADMDIDDDKFLKSAMHMISNAKNRGLPPDRFETFFAEYDNVKLYSDIYEKYEAELRRTNCLDFDDLLVKVYELFDGHPNILHKYAERFRYVHIDEFQDTNEIQFQIVRMLCSVHGNIFAVGDDDQSIYGWRGAEIRNILHFKKNFLNAKVYKLERNYRSTKKIIEASNKLIQHNSERMSKELWTENEDGCNVEYYSAFDELQEAYYVVNRLKTLMNESEYRYSDFAVLMRVNAMSRNIEQEFIKYNIPYRMFGGFKFYERKEIKDAIAYMRVLLNPYDDDAVLRIINTPKRGIGQGAIEALSGFARSRSMSLSQAVFAIEESGLTHAVVNKITAFKSVLDELSTVEKTMPIDEFAAYLIRCSGIYAMYLGSDEDLVSKRLNLDEFVSSVSDFKNQNEGATLSDFLQSVTLSADIDYQNDDDNCVTLATIHAVKGLEFKAVFIAGLDEGIFPLSRARSNVAELEEERRLMYVAMTRARERLLITRADSRYLYGKRDHTIRSCFIDELGIAPKKLRAELYQPTEYAASKSYQPAVEPPVGGEKKDLSKCKPGQVVEHKFFGEGIIVAANLSGTPMIDVLFKGIGKKTLAVNLAPITFK